MPKPAVLDSSAVLAVILKEPGGAAVAPFLEGGLLSTVNLAEVHAKLLARGVAPDHAWRLILTSECEFCLLTGEQARVAAELIPITKPFGLSLGDRACLALAIERKATVYTTDKIWKKIPLGVEVEVIR